MKTSAISIAEQGVPVTAIPGKLTLRFVLPVSLLIIVISTLLSVVITRIARERLTLALEERARSLADDLAYNSELGVLTAQQDLLSGFVNGILRQDDILYVQILESNNKILVQKEKPQYKGILR